MNCLHDAPFERLEVEYAYDAEGGQVVAMVKIYHWDGDNAAEIVEDIDTLGDFLKEYVF